MVGGSARRRGTTVTAASLTGSLACAPSGVALDLRKPATRDLRSALHPRPRADRATARRRATASPAASRSPGSPRRRLPAGLVRRAPQHADHRLLGDQRAHRARRRAHRDASGSGRAASCCPTTAPLTIAEQFGTLAALHPGRIDLGPRPGAGLRPDTMFALRRDATLGGPVPRRRARAAGLPGRRARGSPVCTPPRAGAPRAAVHSRLVAVRRLARRARSGCRTRSPRTSRRTRCTTPSRSTGATSAVRAARPPYVIAGVNVIAADTDDGDAEHFHATKRARVGRVGRGRRFTTRRPTWC